MKPVRTPLRKRRGRRPHLRGEVPLLRLAIERSFQIIRLYENWPVAIADRLGLLRRRQRHLLYRLRSDNGTVELIARANGCDVRTIGEIWIGGFYDRLIDPDLLRSRQPVVVDIGTNCGYFAAYIGNRYPHAKLVCFEPEPENRSLAEMNLALNNVRAEINTDAVTVGRVPTVTLNLSGDPRLHTTVSLQDSSRHGIDAERYSGRTVEVPARNINDALWPVVHDSRIALLKVDVEGIDLDLLEALDDHVLSRIDCIVAETEGRDDIGRVAERLRQAGFSVHEDAALIFGRRTPLTEGTSARSTSSC